MPGGFPLGLELCNGTDIGSSLTTGGVSVTGGANTPGSFAQLSASTPHDACWCEVTIFPTGNSSNRQAVDIAVGAAASEVVVVNKLMAISNTGRNCLASYGFPLSIPAGTRVSARSSNSSTNDALNVNMRLYDGAFTMMDGAAGIDAIGFNSATTVGTTLTGGATGAKGSYAQLTAATLRDYMGFFAAFDTGSATDVALLDIAIGAAASEINLVPNFGIFTQATIMAPTPIFWIPVPAGSRLSARIDFISAAAASTINMTLYGIYQ